MSIIELVERFEAATRADEFKGGGHPEDIEATEQEFAEAKRALLTALGVDPRRVLTPAQVRLRVVWPRGTRFVQVAP